MIMKRIKWVLLLAATTAFVMIPSAVVAADATRPGFTNLTEVVDFLAQCVQANDLARFTNACVQPRNDTQMHANVFKGLKSLDARKPLKEIYAGKQLPTNTPSFMMGGHNKELGFINIPLLKTNGEWYIADYFYCR